MMTNDRATNQATWQSSHVVTPTEAGVTVRELLSLWLIPKRLQHYLRVRQDVLVDEKYRPYSMPVAAGDHVTLTVRADELQTPLQAYEPDERMSIPVLFENDDLVVIDKPTGVKSHPNQAGERGTVMNYLTTQLSPQGVAPAMVHRLDMATSGAMIVAKTPLVVPILDRLISDKRIDRTYVAWVAGHFDHQTGAFSDAIGRDPDDKRKRMLDGERPQTALTHYEVLDETPTATLVQLTLATGRTHQLRVHLAGNGHAILGDPLYANREEQERAPRLMLHARRLNLLVPFTGQRTTVTAPLPPDFATFTG
ncbi:RluA family pseudouridine synthase [Furfurilactobacillus sp. WILCCON 0119]